MKVCVLFVYASINVCCIKIIELELHADTHIDEQASVLRAFAGGRCFCISLDHGHTFAVGVTGRRRYFIHDDSATPLAHTLRTPMVILGKDVCMRRRVCCGWCMIVAVCLRLLRKVIRRWMRHGRSDRSSGGGSGCSHGGCG